jgi:hypothetical protein
VHRIVEFVLSIQCSAFRSHPSPQDRNHVAHNNENLNAVTQLHAESIRLPGHGGEAAPHSSTSVSRTSSSTCSGRAATFARISGRLRLPIGVGLSYLN